MVHQINAVMASHRRLNESSGRNCEYDFEYSQAKLNWPVKEAEGFEDGLRWHHHDDQQAKFHVLRKTQELEIVGHASHVTVQGKLHSGNDWDFGYTFTSTATTKTTSCLI